MIIQKKMYNLEKIRMNIELNDEIAEKIVVSTLKESAVSLSEEINKLLQKSDLKSFQKQDLLDHIEDLAAINRVLVYYGGQPVNWTGYIDPLMQKR